MEQSLRSAEPIELEFPFRCAERRVFVTCILCVSSKDHWRQLRERSAVKELHHARDTNDSGEENRGSGGLNTRKELVPAPIAEPPEQLAGERFVIEFGRIRCALDRIADGLALLQCD